MDVSSEPAFTPFQHLYISTFFFTEGALLFTQEPGDKVYVQEGSSAILTWAYTVDNRAAELKRITWTIYNKTLGADVTLILEGKSGNVMYNPNVPPTYGPDRVTKVGQASILIKNVTFKDSADYTCILAGEGSTPNVQDEVALIVTGTCMFYRVQSEARWTGRGFNNIFHKLLPMVE